MTFRVNVDTLSERVTYGVNRFLGRDWGPVAFTDPYDGQGRRMTTLRVWAPGKDRVEVEVEGQRHAMTDAPGGWWQLELPDAGPGTDYAFCLDGGPPRPDPRSAWQPQGVHGPSRLVDHAAFDWTDQLWRGLPLPGAVLYELHVGTFTPQGTFDAAVGQLDGLVELGIHAVELLPCNAYDGRWGWGYDGVAWLAVHEPYGGPEGLKRFVDACHARGLAVVMDAVYNHLGPAGNYLPEFGPYLTDAHHTPWGPAVNLDMAGSDEVRRLVRDSALGWLRDYHVDGLRLDAVHALVDERATPLLEELAVEVDALGRAAAQAPVAGRGERPERPAAGHCPGGGRRRAGRAVGRRRAPRAARAAHRRAVRLLRRLRQPRHAGQGADRRVRARRQLVQLPRPHARPSGAGDAAGPPVRGVPAGPRPGRQPGDR